MFASMTGDPDVVRLLLSRGAQPDAEALSEAVTFDHPDIVKALIDAGADANITESSGINLLHWAAITNRPAMIPLLAKAGVPIDAIDGVWRCEPVNGHERRHAGTLLNVEP